MVRLDAFLFGYRRGTVSFDDVPKLLNVFLKLGISSDVDENGKFILRERDAERFCKYCSGRLRYTLGETLGVPGNIKHIWQRKGILLAAFLFILFHLGLSGMIWDVRIDGNERIPDEEILSELSKADFGIGTRWRKTDKNAVETDILKNFSDISWISINRRGTVAYVKVMEAENIGIEKEDAPEYSNILADRDAVISEITVVRGVAVVKPGDVVRRGDVLISGVMETESGTVFCRAEGRVIGQSVGTVSAEIPKIALEKEPLDESIYEIQLKLFNFSINIFKNYGICLNDYDIIKDEREYALFGKYRLPVSLIKTYRSEYTEKSIEYTDSEILEMAREELNKRVNEEFSECDVLKMRSFGKWNGDCYVLSTEIVYLTDIAKESAIDVGAGNTGLYYSVLPD